MRALLLGSLIVFGGAGQALAQAVEVCPQAADEASYRSDFMRVVTPGIDGWLFRTGTDLADAFEVSNGSIRSLGRLTETLAANGTTLVLALTPPRGIIHADKLDPGNPLTSGYDPERAEAGFQAYLDRLRETGAVVVDLLTPALDAAGEVEFYLPQDSHWRPLGARLAAQAIAAQLGEQGLLEGLPAQQFVTESAPEDYHQGLFSDTINEICGTELPATKILRFETKPAVQADAAALVADAPLPSVVLVGTSFSAPNEINLFNFAGFLQEALGTDVLNHAVEGGNMEVGLLAYLASDDYRESKPKLLIWEIPGFTTLNRGAVYAQAIPAAVGACAPDAAVIEATTELGAGGPVSLVPLDGAAVADGFAYLEVADPTLVEFTVAFRRGGEAEEVEIERSTRVPNNGRFFVELPDGDAPLEAIELVAEGSYQGAVTTRLCSY